jgi:hypothetical protein
MNRFDHPTIKRSEALIPLSREHFTGLVRARRLIKAANQDRIERHKAPAGFLDAWNAEIAAYFESEERLFHELISDEDGARLIREHNEIRSLVTQAHAMRLLIVPEPEFLETLGCFLRDHIRWEERELFSTVESTLSKQQLSEIANETEQIENTRARYRPFGGEPD